MGGEGTQTSQYIITGGGAGSTSRRFGVGGCAEAGGQRLHSQVPGWGTSRGRGGRGRGRRWALGVGRRRVVLPLIAKSPGVEQCEVNCRCAVHEEELVAQHRGGCGEGGIGATGRTRARTWSKLHGRGGSWRRATPRGVRHRLESFDMEGGC